MTFNALGGPFESTVHVRYTGTVNLATGEFNGHFVVLNGTGELANLRAQGAMWACTRASKGDSLTANRQLAQIGARGEEKLRQLVSEQEFYW